ncbi:BPSS1780 family membrane protein [Janthinobacterium agaricidamnosum]|uniref:Putative membrane protein n=1 Tax=Janthinobacterium agaricidamnosum NBRC 102515 = DSM 9628 TaxID=1349767 RepID=W0VC13_9BURK|nr:BPSS1780 family membrane protein [Janthinobacterium agaricidamnosum]CDG85175.1 putative membrane protein [Janthinobacterium agaricidamnosum NBRC 102515 = DSM 9628]
MEKLPAVSGWLWVKQGFGLFCKQPGGLTTLFLGYMLCMLAVNFIPVLGQLLTVILVPVFSVAFLQGCLTIEQGKRILPNLLASGFRKPAVSVLLGLGGLYIAMFLFAIGVSALIDGGVLWQFVTGQINPDNATDIIRGSNMGMALLVMIALYIPAVMGFCFAAPLIYWKQLSLGKALFFSFFAVWRSKTAFLVFAAVWLGISVTTSQLLFGIVGRTQMAMQLMMPVSMILTVIMHCSFYASYRHIFGAPQATPVSLDKTPTA